MDIGEARHCMAMIGEFARQEELPNLAQMPLFAPNVGIVGRQAVEAFLSATAREVDDLIAARLVADDDRVPLLGASDFSAIMAKLNPTSFGDRAARYVAATLVEEIAFLSAIHRNFYTAFWRFVEALASAGWQAGDPDDPERAAEVRTRVYRATMSPASWRTLTQVRLALIAGVSPQDLLIGLTEGGTALERVLRADFDFDKLEDGPAQRVRFARYAQYYAARAREIWPEG